MALHSTTVPCYAPCHMLNVEINRSGTDNTQSVLRKFSRRVQGSGLIPHIRKNRYRIRPLSDAKKKLGAIHRIAKEEERVQLIKEGKVSEAPERGPRRPSFRMNTETPKTETITPAAAAPEAAPETN